MFRKIKQFLVDWDLMPILWPTRQDGFLQFAIPAAIGALSLFGAKKDRDAQKKSAENAAANQQAWAKAISPETLMGRYGEGTAIGDWLRSEDPAQQLSQSSTSTWSKSTPFITDEYKGLHGLTKGLVESRLKSGSSLPEGYEAAGVRAINRANTAGLEATRGTDAVTSSLGERAEVGRRGQIADFLAGVPLQERSAQMQDLQFAANLITSLGRGVDTRGGSSTSSKSWTEGGLSPGQQFLLQSYMNSNAAKYGGAQAPVGGDPGFGAAAAGLGAGWQAYLAGKAAKVG